MNQALKTTTLAISGMTCGGCANGVTRVLSGVPDVQSAAVDYKTGLASIIGAAPVDKLVAAVVAAGYGAQPADRAGAEGGRHGER